MRGRRGCRLTLNFFKEGARAMTLLTTEIETYRERSTAVLETERLVLRAPQLEDAKTIAALAGPRPQGEAPCCQSNVSAGWFYAK